MIINPSQYRSLNTNQFPVFMMPWYLDTVYGKNCWRAFLEYRDSQIFALLPFSESPEGCIAMPAITQYAGPYLQIPDMLSRAKRYSLQEQLLSSLLEQVDQFGIDCYAQRWGTWIENWMPAFWLHYQHEPRFTYLLNCRQPYDEIYQGFSTQVRNKLKRISIQIAEEQSVEKLYDLQNESLGLQGKKPKFSYDELAKLANAAFIHDCGTVLYAYANNQCLSAAFLLWDKYNVYYYIAGNDRRYLQHNSSTILIDRCIRLACKQKKIFDFTGSMLPSLSRYYRGFGATLFSYPIITKISCVDEAKAEFHKNRMRDYIFKF